MFKVTPNPPAADPASPYVCPGSKQFNEAAERALDHHLGPLSAHMMAVPYAPNRFYQVNPAIANEPLLVDVCETLGSATVMLNDFAGVLEGSHRKTAQGIAQIVMVAEIAANRLLDKLVPTE
jgi:hypothetical protein